MTTDTFTEWARSVLRFALVQHPTRASIGFSGGILANTIIDLFRPKLSSLGLNLAALTDFRLAIAGLFIANVGMLFKKEKLPEAIEQEFAAIAKAIQVGGLSGTHQKLLYQQLALKVISGANIRSKPHEAKEPGLVKPSRSRRDKAKAQSIE